MTVTTETAQSQKPNGNARKLTQTLMSESRKYRYMLRLVDGRRIYADGTGPEDAARAAGVTMPEIRRHMPIKAYPTGKELERQRQRFAKLREKQRGN